MRICLLTHTFPRFPKDVAAPFMDGVARSLVDAGNEVFVLTPYSPKFAWKKSELPYKLITYKYIFPDSFHRLGYSETLNNDMSLKFIMLALSPFLYFFGVISLIKLIKKEKIEIVNAHWILPNGFIAVVAKMFTGVPVVSTLPGSDVYMLKMNQFFRILGIIATKISSVVTSNSSQLILDLEKLTRTSLRNKSQPIIYGVDPKKFKPDSSWDGKLKKDLKIPSNAKIVLGVGRLVAKKGFEYLIKAAPSVLRKNKNTYFVIIGEGDQREYLKDLAVKLKVSERFIFTGWVNYSDLMHYYNLSNMFILPSVRDEEGNLDDQSVSVVEAMACGKPVITSDFPGYRSVINDQKDGFLVSEKDSKGIFRVINKLLSSEKLQNKVGKAARESIIRSYSWQAIGLKYSQLFSEVISKDSYSSQVPRILNTKERIRIAKQIYKIVSLHLGKTKKLTCLDIGCSSGVISNYLAKNFSKVVAIDVDEKALKVANEKYKKSNLKFVNIEAEKMNFKSSSFDVVIANQIYEFVKDDEVVLKEIKRVLKKGGICFLGARNKYALIEAQYGVPFLSWIPNQLSNFVVKLLGRGDKFVGKYRSYPELLNLVKGLKLHDYTTRIIKKPSFYGFKRLNKFWFLKYLPIEILKPFIPNYIWILEK